MKYFFIASIFLILFSLHSAHPAQAQTVSFQPPVIVQKTASAYEITTTITAPSPAGLVVSGALYLKTTDGSKGSWLEGLAEKTLDTTGVYADTFSTKNFTNNTDYIAVFTFKTLGITETSKDTIVQTPKAAVPTGTKSLSTNDPNRYDLLAPIPGLKAVLDPVACEEAKTTNPEEICDINQFINFMLKLLIGICAVILVVRLIIAGYAYMTTDVPFVKFGAKNTFYDALMGLLIALSSYLILNTINPRLVNNSFSLQGADFEVEVFSRADDPLFVSGLDQYDTTGISVDINNLSELQLAYLAHQQGVAGASAIIWSAKKGYRTVPTDNPYTKSNINRNMAANFPKSSAQKTIGTSELTPATFLKYWAVKVEAIKRSSSGVIPAFIDDEIKKVSTETSVSLENLRVMCRIEAYKACSTRESITHINKYGFTGLFQLGQSVWKAYGKKEGSIVNAYHNAFAAAQYYKNNLIQIRKNISSMR